MQSRQKPLVLMVSGGSDSMALLEMVCAGELGDEFAERDVYVLHVNHLLRGADADKDERFVERSCAALGVPCIVRRVDVAALSAKCKCGIEATAHELRYKLACELLDTLCMHSGVRLETGLIATAHTLDDRVETFYMRSLVGTGPGGFASIARKNGRVRRPLLDMTREQLREWLRARHRGLSDEKLWREDCTNDDGSNFRSRIRHELIPVLRALHPGFEVVLARTMDLIAAEDAALCDRAAASVYTNLCWDGNEASLPVSVLKGKSRPQARRILRASLLVVNSDARLESSQIERILDHLDVPGYTTETSGGIRVRLDADKLFLRKV